MRHIARDPPGTAGSELARLTANRERDRALDHEAHLLVGVRVLREMHAGVELDKGERQLVAVDSPACDPVPDPLPRDRADIAEELHEASLGARRADLVLGRGFPPGTPVVSPLSSSVAPESSRVARGTCRFCGRSAQTRCPDVPRISQGGRSWRCAGTGPAATRPAASAKKCSPPGL